jgi:TRAP-type C4-dicarboxylate transport system permease small subunit
MNESDQGSAPAGSWFLGLRAGLGWLDWLSYGAIVVVMGLMATLVALQVFFRYALGMSAST